MALEQISNKILTHTTAKTTSKPKVEERTTTEKPQETDSFDITRTTKGLKQALAAIDAAPVVDAKRVAAVKAELESGNYKIDAETIAEKMIAFEKQLPDTR